MEMQSARYGAAARHLHWAMAVVIAVAFVLGLVVDAFPKSWEHPIVETHKALGLLVLALLVVRLVNRGRKGVPQALPAHPLLALATKAGHALLYVLMLVVPAVGLYYALRRGQGLDLVLFKIPPLLTADRAAARPFREVHEVAAWALILLAAGHAAVALWHHFVRRDGVLRRMLPKA